MQVCGERLFHHAVTALIPVLCAYPMPPLSTTPASESFVDAVVAGLGWGMVPRAQAEPRLRAGRLVDLDPRHPIDVPLFWQQWKLDSPALAATADAVAAAAARELLSAR